MDTLTCYICGTKAVGERQTLIDSGWQIMKNSFVFCGNCSHKHGAMPSRPITDITTERLILATNMLKGL